MISQQYFSLRTNQPPATSQNQPAVLFSLNKPAPVISHQPTEQAAGTERFYPIYISSLNNTINLLCAPFSLFL
jgi:hypothetical protein